MARTIVWLSVVLLASCAGDIGHDSRTSDRSVVRYVLTAGGGAHLVKEDS